MVARVERARQSKEHTGTHHEARGGGGEWRECRGGVGGERPWRWWRRRRWRGRGRRRRWQSRKVCHAVAAAKIASVVRVPHHPIRDAKCTEYDDGDACGRRRSGDARGRRRSEGEHSGGEKTRRPPPPSRLHPQGIGNQTCGKTSKLPKMATDRPGGTQAAHLSYCTFASDSRLRAGTPKSSAPPLSASPPRSFAFLRRVARCSHRPSLVQPSS
jgi:hypothetical protein